MSERVPQFQPLDERHRGTGEAAQQRLVQRAAEAIAPARWRRDSALQARLMVVLVCLALVSTNAWLVFNDRTQTLQEAAMANMNLARAVAERVEGAVADTEHILNGVVFELERSGTSPQVMERLQPLLATHAQAAAQLDGLFVVDTRGRTLVSSQSAMTPAGEAVDRADLAHHARQPGPEALVTGPLLSQSSGAWVFSVTRRFNDRAGDFAGVVLATMSVKHLRGVLDRFDLGGDGAITLTLSNRILVRRPYREVMIGVETPQAMVRELFTGRVSGSTEARSPMDGVWRIISFDHTRSYPIRVTVASSKDDVLANWRASAIFQTVWVSFLCVILGLAGTWIRLLTQRQDKAEAGLRQARDALAVANARLSRMAQYDGLTGLANRRYLDTRLMQFFRQAQRHQRPMAVVMVDVDEFKKYNDLYGHVQGDECLRRVANALRTAAGRPQDFVARYGGEEMVLLLPETELDGAARVAEAARQAVIDQQIPHEGSALGQVSVSLGVAAWVPAVAETPYEMLQSADAALYQAKRQGRNRVQLDGSSTVQPD
ncbi:sensor domain-containing diguanylate cyclase [Pseudorhodoferax sp. Leaf267]|uniref:GGDEF domain-containing protein n=1 Tax=Pseudorhodoferax sp. Leaf267 TaxID=1736316 RepID=UPI000A866D47|nr:sensor domain-containing diguanylate cyclase [Pseudorhodoferax sp. Leaf267]